MKLGIISAKDNRKAEELSQKISNYLKEKGHEILSGSELKGSEAIFVVGGDGTLLHSACANVELDVPFIGINRGTLGFLTAVEGGDWQKIVEKVLSGNLAVSEGMTIEAELNGKNYRAINEIVVKSAYRVVKLEIIVNDQKFLSISGDGVIVSTQMGSTAYSLSSGGPIVDHEIDSMLITPISAHGLPIPSVVISPKDRVTIKILEGNDVSLVIDGQDHTKVEKGQNIRVSQGKYRVKFGYLDKHHFLKALNVKFGLASRLNS